MDEVGWAFASVQLYPDAEEDPLYGFGHAKDLYLKADPDYTGRSVAVGYPHTLYAMHVSLRRMLRYTVPILWDKKNETIVNNESAEIIRILNTGFNSLLPAEKAAIDLYPEDLRNEIDPLNDLIYAGINSEYASEAQINARLITLVKTVCIGPGLRRHRTRTKKRCTRCSTPLIRSKSS